MNLIVQSTRQQIPVEDVGSTVHELAQIFAAELVLAEFGPFLFQKGRVDARALGSRSPDAEPLGAAILPGFEKESGPGRRSALTEITSRM
jgi:hypothetical protein